MKKKYEHYIEEAKNQFDESDDSNTFEEDLGNGIEVNLKLKDLQVDEDDEGPGVQVLSGLIKFHAVRTGNIDKETLIKNVKDFVSKISID